MESPLQKKLDRKWIEASQRITELEAQLAECRNQYLGQAQMYEDCQRERDDFEQARDLFEKLNADHWKQLAASQAREQQLRDACQKGHLSLIYKLGGTYKEGYGGSTRDAESAVLMYETLATPTDDTALRAWGAKLLRDCYNKCEYLADLMDIANEMESKP